MTLLARLLDEWRSTFDERLVEPIIVLGGQLAKLRPPLRASTQAALEEAWHARLALGDPADVDLLLDARWPKTDLAIRRRLAALAIASPDPRYPPKLLERDQPRAAIAWRGGSQYGFIEDILLPLADAGVKEIAIHADGRGRTATEYTLRDSKKRLAGCEVHFGGVMLDVATVPAAASAPTPARGPRARQTVTTIRPAGGALPQEAQPREAGPDAEHDRDPRERGPAHPATMIEGDAARPARRQPEGPLQTFSGRSIVARVVPA